jgi:hypothetical protein
MAASLRRMGNGFVRELSGRRRQSAGAGYSFLRRRAGDGSSKIDGRQINILLGQRSRTIGETLPVWQGVPDVPPTAIT